MYLERVRQTGSANVLISLDQPNGNLTVLPQDKFFYAGRGWDSGNALPLMGLRPIPIARTPSPLRPRPAFDVATTAASVVNVLEHGCKGDWVTDDTACLQSAIDSGKLVFLPFGFFRVTDTIQLRANTRLVGEGLSRIVLSDNATGFSNPNLPKPMLQTANDVDGSTQIAGVRLTSGAFNPGAILLDWAVGSQSSLWDVHITVGSAPEGAGGFGVQDHGEVHTLFHLHNSGGGVFSNVHGWGADHNVSNDQGLPDGHAAYGVRSTASGPATFVGCAFEHHTLSAFNLTGASNHTFFALQTEQTEQSLVVEGSDGVLVYGTVITWSGDPGRTLVKIQGAPSTRVEIYGLNTLMKRISPSSPPWQMLYDARNASCGIPALARGPSGSGNWGGRCGSGDCAMVAVLNPPC